MRTGASSPAPSPNVRGWKSPAVLALAGLALALLPGLALAAERSEEEQGAQVLREVEDGERDCADLASGDFELVGEYVMGRMVGSPGAHEAMDRMMESMMGETGVEQMHELMGRRFAGCGGGRVPASFGGMMGMMGMMGGGPGAFRGGPGGGPGQGGAFPGMMGGGGFPGMMGGSFLARDRNDGGDDDWDGAAIAMTILMLVLVAIAIVALIAWRPWRQPGRGRSALELLQQRLARGEIDAEEYRRRREALGGSR